MKDLLPWLLAQVDNAQDEIVSLAQALVRIPTVNTGVMPTGDESRACRFLEDRLAKEGIKSETLEAAPGRGNFLACVDGTEPGPRLIYASHIDVVPVEAEEEWVSPPFSGQIIDGRLYGRGATDCKGLLTCQLMALVILKRAGLRLRGDLVLASAADEEAGGRYGFQWLVENHPEKIRADYGINEGGGEVVRRPGAPAYVLGIGEKGRLEVHITIKGTPAHASTPWQGDNALTRASEVLQRLAAYRPQIDLSSEMFPHLKNLGVAEAPTRGNIDGIAQRVASRDRELASRVRGLSRMTIAPTLIKGGIKSNSIPALCRITCDVRTLPHQDLPYVKGEFERLLGNVPGVEIDIDYTAVPSVSPYETKFASKVKAATEKALGDRELVWLPAISVPFSDSRFLRPLGTVAYGFQLSHPEDEVWRANVHGTNESVDVRNLMAGTKMLVALALEVLG